MSKSKVKILSIDSLSIGYLSGKKKNLLLSPLDASASKGELVAVIGRNGIGKSTLLRTIAGLQPSLGGNVFIEGTDINDYSRIDLAEKIGFISTEVVKVANMKVYDLVSLGRFPYTNWLGKLNRRDHEIIVDSIEKTGMTELSYKNIMELSDGERQRAMVARVLAQDTDIMIMDEPTAFLDVRNKFEMIYLLHELSQGKGKTIIFSTHDLNIAISKADKIWLTNNDSLYEGAPEDLMINGSFDHLFDSSVIGFNKTDGNFSFKSKDRGPVFVEGKGTNKHWTEKAIIRSGFSLSEERCDWVIKVIEGEAKGWQVNIPGKSMEFPSIYELIDWLSFEKNQAI